MRCSLKKEKQKSDYQRALGLERLGLGILLGGLLLSQVAEAATYVNRYVDAAGRERSRAVELEGETTWDVGGSPYVVEQDLTVAQGASLRIDPGVVVRIVSKLTVQGTLKARGVTFEGPLESSWKGIYFGANAGASIIEDCRIYDTGVDQGFYYGKWTKVALYVDQSSPIITGNTIRPAQGNGVEVYHSNAVIRDNTFELADPASYPVWLNDGNSFLVMSGNQVSGDGVSGVGLPASLTITENGRWSHAGDSMPYLPGGDVILALEAELSIDAGVVIQNKGLWTVLGALKVEGSEGSPVRFLGPWKGIYFGPSAGESELHFASFQDGGNGEIGFFQSAWRKAAVYLDQVAPVMEDVVIDGSASVGLELYDSSATFLRGAIRNSAIHAVVSRGTTQPRLVHTSIATNSAVDHYVVWSEVGSVPVPDGLVFENNARQGVQIVAGSLAADRRLTSWGNDVPYVLTGDMTVEEGVTLSVEPGTVLKVDAAKIWVAGTLTADSLANPVVFTSAADDSIGGDSNGDGAETLAEAGAWKGIYLGPQSGASVLRGCEFRYAGQSTLGFLQGVWRQVSLYVDESSPVIDQNLFRDSLGNGVGIHKGQPVVSDNEFVRLDPTGYPIAVNSLEAFPLLSGNRSAETAQSGVRILSGDIAHEARWRNPGPGLAYMLIGNLRIAEGASLQIDAGTRIESVGLWTILGRLTVEGTIEAPVSMGGDWAGLYFGPTSGDSILSYLQVSGVAAKDLGFFYGVWRKACIFVDSTSPRFDHVQLLNGAFTGLELYGSNATINDLVVQGCGAHGLVAQAGSRPVINGATLLENGALGYFTVLTDASSVPIVSEMMLNGNSQQGIEVRGGTISTDTLWIPWAENAPYVVTGDITIAPDTVLEVAPQSIVKLSAVKLWVEGSLRAQAEPYAIAFTSMADDSIGGDTNGNGDETLPAAGDWIGIYLGPGAGESVLEGVSLRYGGRGDLGFFEGSWRRATLYVDQNQAVLRDNWVRDSLGSGLEMFAASPIVVGNRFENMGADRFPILYRDLNSFPEIAHNEAGGTGNLAVSIPAGDLGRSGTWMKAGRSLPYWPQGDIGIPAGLTLTLEPGVEIQLLGSKLNVLGTLFAQGEFDQGIHFVGRPGAEAPANWDGIYFGPEAGDSMISFGRIAHAGGGDLGFLDGVWRKASVYIDQSAPTIQQTFVIEGQGEGIHLASSQSVIRDSLIAGHGRAGLVSRGSGRPQLTNLTVVDNQGDGVWSENGALALSNSLITHNGGRGLNLQADAQFELARVHHNLLFGNTGDDLVMWSRYEAGGQYSNLNGDPLYRDRAVGDYRLQVNSPAVDAGTGEEVFAIDLAGKVRWHGQSIDIGAYEHDAPPVSYGVDLAVRKEGDEQWIGEGEISPAVQVIESRWALGQEATHEIHFEYTGNAFDQIRMFGNMPPEGWDVRASLDVVEGFADITEALYGEEGYPVLALVQGAEVGVRLHVTPDPGNNSEVEWLATIRAQGTKGQFDEVQVRMSVGAPPQILEQPSGGMVDEGSDVSLQVVAEGEGELSYQWLRNGVDLPGAVNASLLVPSISVAEAGDYSVAVSGEFGTVISQTVSLRVHVAPLEELQIVSQPLSQTVEEYDEVILRVEPRGEGPFSYQWVRDDDPLCGEKRPQLRFPSIHFHQRAFYSVVVTDRAGIQVASDKVVVDVMASEREEVIVFDNQNIGAVVNEPTEITQFTLEEPLWLTKIETYHWNHGQGQSLGEISLENESGDVYGPWEALGRCGQGGLVNAYWAVYPLETIPAGTYTVIDSDPATWSHNAESSGRGFVNVSGVWEFEAPSGDSEFVQTTGIQGLWEQGGSGTWFAQDRVTIGDGPSLQSGAIADSEESRIQVSLQGPGAFSFFWKISAEGADPVSFWVDGEQIHSIRGETDWEEVHFPVRWGTHTLSWTYRKDSSISVGEDAAWLGGFKYDPVQLFEPAEVLDQIQVPLQVLGEAPWFGQDAVLYNGAPTVQTGNISHSQRTDLGLSVFGPGRLSFVWKSSTENADRLHLLDGEAILATIQGETDWTELSIDLRWGQHDLRWRYQKDSSVHRFEDAAWIANLAYEPVATTELGVALESEALEWETSGGNPWFGQAEVSMSGGFAAQSGNIGDSESSDLTTTVTGPGTLLFHWRASSENSDRGHFLIDDEVKTSLWGEQDWQVLAYAIDPGEHTLTWRYQKDSSVHSLGDAVWVDQVTFSREAPAGLEAVLPITIDSGSHVAQWRALTGRIFLVEVTGTDSGSVWGTDEYTDYSILSRAVVHAGVLKAGESGIVQVTMLPGKDEYRGSERNGVTSLSYHEWPASYRVEGVAAVPTVPPVLQIRLLEQGLMEVSWESSEDQWRLESSAAVGSNATWTVVEASRVVGTDRWSIELFKEWGTGFFRLTR